jgi:antitoxin component of MazEF toxin-antitoxin module
MLPYHHLMESWHINGRRAMVKRIIIEMDGGVGLVIPPTLAAQLDLTPGTLLNITRQKQSLVLRKRSARGRRDAGHRKISSATLRGAKSR